MTNQTPAEALRQQISKTLQDGTMVYDGGENKIIFSTDTSVDAIMELVTAYAATVEREAAIKAVKHLVDHYKDNASYGYGDSGEWMTDAEEYLAALQGPLDGSDGLIEPVKP